MNPDDIVWQITYKIYSNWLHDVTPGFCQRFISRLLQLDGMDNDKFWKWNM